jgi:D-xylose transport system ATP-binding protein
MTDPQNAPMLEVEDARKAFGAVQALGGASLTLARGEVLALLGDNGAGKSTLIKAISGVHQLDQGTIRIEGARVAMKHPSDARSHGIETVYQDLALFDNLSAVANLFAARESVAPRWFGGLGLLRERRMHRDTVEMVRRLKVGISDLRGAVGLMSGGQRQAIAVARAVAFAKRIVILDEPTAALGIRESRTVLELVRRLPEQGIGVILISHNLEHVAEVADRAIVMRRGCVVGEAVPTAANHEQIVSWIVGSLEGER